MEFFLFIARFLIFPSVICLSNSEKTEKVQMDEHQIQYNLIADETNEPNKFHISYEVSYGEFIFKRFEKCHIVEEVGIRANDSELSCIGKTKFSRIGDVKNVSNFNDYTYSSNGFNHTGETFKVSGNYYRVKELDLMYGQQAEPITLKLNATPAVKQLRFDRVEKSLIVNFTIDSAFFAMNRTENFSVGIDEETGSDDLICVGRVVLIVRNSDTYQTVQSEVFELDEDYAFVYVSEAKFLTNDNGTNTDTDTDTYVLI
ncbi:uncharacterized protein LOC119078325 [Bradysia coprophila]|uniref:uncharacterized protein LOC119078325 n=1 Tax=Bradysia coprophila TaxID=38358 RepID=UPI00187D925D|nr:uncharacterized protein LOC119078325 [Bradysia coprophila]